MHITIQELLYRFPWDLILVNLPPPPKKNTSIFVTKKNNWHNIKTYRHFYIYLQCNSLNIYQSKKKMFWTKLKEEWNTHFVFTTFFPKFFDFQHKQMGQYIHFWICTVSTNVLYHYKLLLLGKFERFLDFAHCPGILNKTHLRNLICFCSVMTTGGIRTCPVTDISSV
jgi:hypothetical protein